MVGTFFYLTVCGIRNRIRVRFRRLREPRYLIGTIVGLLYLYFFLFRRGMGRSPLPSTRPGGPPADLLARASDALLAFGSMAALIFAALMWIWPASRRALEFSRAEVQFLFQAPVSRRDLLHYKLLRSQLGLFFGSVILALVFRPSSLGSSWRLLIGTWLALTVSRLYSLGVSFTRESLVRHGARGFARLWPPLVALAAVGIVGAAIAAAWPQLGKMSDASDVFRVLPDLTSTGAAGVVLMPFRALVGLPLSASTLDFLTRLPAVLAMMALMYWWVVQSDTAFEEASAEQAEKQAAQPKRTAQPKLRRAPFALSLEGRAETAILWKNLIMVGRYLSLRTLAGLVPMVVILALAVGRGGGRGGVATAVAVACLAMTGITLLLGPQIARNDLRQDLENLAVLKAWPVSGPALLRGEILAPLVILSVVAWLLILCAAVLFGSLPSTNAFSLEVLASRTSYAVAAILVAPGVIVSQLVIQNGIAVLFPAWVSIGATRARGIDAMGQRILMLFGLMLSLVISLIPAALAAALVMLAVYMATGVIAVIAPAAAALVVLIGEGALATEWLGRILDRTDISAVEPAE